METIRKIMIVNIILILCTSLSYAQEYKVLNIGDSIPKSFYDEVAKLGLAGKLFSETKNKLVILDFWNTSCGTCIVSLPKMERLQNEFRSDVKVFLVNAFEDSSRIAARMQLPFLKKYNVDLPSIANAIVFQQLFPHRIVPHHVLIDKDRVVRVIGSSLNTNSQKIEALLRGEEVYSLRGENNSRLVTEETSLFQLLGKEFKGGK